MRDVQTGNLLLCVSRSTFNASAAGNSPTTSALHTGIAAREIVSSTFKVANGHRPRTGHHLPETLTFQLRVSHEDRCMVSHWFIPPFFGTPCIAPLKLKPWLGPHTAHGHRTGLWACRTCWTCWMCALWHQRTIHRSLLQMACKILGQSMAEHQQDGWRMRSYHHGDSDCLRVISCRSIDDYSEHSKFQKQSQALYWKWPCVTMWPKVLKTCILNLCTRSPFSSFFYLFLIGQGFCVDEDCRVSSRPSKWFARLSCISPHFDPLNIFKSNQSTPKNSGGLGTPAIGEKMPFFESRWSIIL